MSQRSVIYVLSEGGLIMRLSSEKNTLHNSLVTKLLLVFFSFLLNYFKSCAILILNKWSAITFGVDYYDLDNNLMTS